VVLRLDRGNCKGHIHVSTKVGIITEGVIDEALLPPLLERIALDRADFDWPVEADDLAEIFPMRKRGHGGVLDTVRKLVAIMDSSPPSDHAFFVILLDARTRPVYERVRKLISGKHRFVLGLAIEEIEAWWLADRQNTLAWLRLPPGNPTGCRYWDKDYSPEQDPDPKVTLDELTLASPNLDRRYGKRGNVSLAWEFAEEHWRPGARLDAIGDGCPKGFRPFCRKATQEFRHEKARQRRLV